MVHCYAALEHFHKKLSILVGGGVVNSNHVMPEPRLTQIPSLHPVFSVSIHSLHANIGEKHFSFILLPSIIT